MATHVKIEGVAPYNGSYDLDVSYFTNGELHTIKQIADVRAGELEEAFDADDNDLIVAFAIIALQRAGIRVDPARLWNAPVGKIILHIDDEEAVEERPPDTATPTGNESSDVVASDASANPVSSGTSSNEGGDHPGNGQSRTGTDGSDGGSASDPETSLPSLLGNLTPAKT